jgi:hypothetical protein
MNITYVAASRGREGTSDVADVLQYHEGHLAAQGHLYAADDDLRRPFVALDFSH